MPAATFYGALLVQALLACFADHGPVVARVLPRELVIDPEGEVPVDRGGLAPWGRTGIPLPGPVRSGASGGRRAQLPEDLAAAVVAAASGDDGEGPRRRWAFGPAARYWLNRPVLPVISDTPWGSQPNSA